jgi:hypothetical protein
MPFDIKANMEFMNQLINIGHFKPLIDRVYPLDDVAEHRFFINQFTSVILPISEFSTILWLLIKGVKEIEKT